MAEHEIDVEISEDVASYLHDEVAPSCSWTENPELTAEHLRGLAGLVLDEEGIDRDVELCISLVSPERIHELNLTFRNVDRPTDVLSFPCDDPNDTPEGMPVELGDIFLAPKIVLAQSQEFETTFTEEADLLVTHGMLHLLGYDHIIDGEAEVMEARERDILAVWRRDG